MIVDVSSRDITRLQTITTPISSATLLQAMMSSSDSFIAVPDVALVLKLIQMVF